jgi:hypothetical protein
MIPALAALDKVPHGALISLVRDELLAVADIRMRQEAGVAARILPDWTDRLRHQHHALKAAADALLVFITDGQDAIQRGRKLPPPVLAVSDALRSSLMHERRLESGTTGEPDVDAA